jgi:hypothetical protein
MEQALHTLDPVLYGRLHRGTISKWIVKGEKRWTDQKTAAIERRSALSGTGRVGVLTPHPELRDAIKAKLIAVRVVRLSRICLIVHPLRTWHLQVGVAVNRLLARSVMLAMIKELKPELLETKFKCSEVCSLLVSEIRHDTDPLHV